MQVEDEHCFHGSPSLLMPETTATLLHDLIDEVMQAARADGEAVDVMLEKMLLILRHDQQNG